MRSFANCLLFTAALIIFAGCDRVPPQPPAAEPKPAGVTANSGGDTRGTVLYQSGPLSAHLPDPYTAVSGKFVLAQRQRLAWELAEIDQHAHRQAAEAYPVPTVSSPGYSKSKAQTAAEQQALFNTYLLEKYHARFCNQFHVSYDQLTLITEEGRDKNWPLPPAPRSPD